MYIGRRKSDEPLIRQQWPRRSAADSGRCCGQNQKWHDPAAPGGNLSRNDSTAIGLKFNRRRARLKLDGDALAGSKISFQWILDARLLCMSCRDGGSAEQDQTDAEESNHDV